MIILRDGDPSIDGVWFPNGYQLDITYGYLQEDGSFWSYGTKFTEPYRRCKLEDQDGNIISEFVEKNPERIPKEIFDIVYPEDAECYETKNG